MRTSSNPKHDLFTHLYINCAEPQHLQEERLHCLHKRPLQAVQHRQARQNPGANQSKEPTAS
jgi:hypothetical protein